MTHIRETIVVTVDPHRYIAPMMTAISSVVHTALTYLESSKSCIHLLFLDFSSAFNTITHRPSAEALFSWTESHTGELGPGLPDQQTSDCQDPQHCFLLFHPQHWLAPGLGVEPPPVQSADV
ncbi:hypothetical protein GOODEAATRI_015954 [Goodea atripinnis]|uniref:Reverse transcriptase domain-containing protein n=1 Tax=Goodea atripinnis TaxID=208336 RepID=A0ABV0PYC9_9TELE